jgi:hypothetical protein
MNHLLSFRPGFTRHNQVQTLQAAELPDRVQAMAGTDMHMVRPQVLDKDMRIAVQFHEGMRPELPGFLKLLLRLMWRWVFCQEAKDKQYFSEGFFIGEAR